MCGDKVDIRDVFILVNVRTGKPIETGRNCKNNYQAVIERMEQESAIDP
jgi:hypothetical protein